MHVARALAAEAPLLLADEPTAALDPLHQHQVMQLLRAGADAGCGVLVVMHDAALAARTADRLLWMADGRIVADGPPEATLTAARLAEVYGVRATVRRIDEDWLVSVTGGRQAAERGRPPPRLVAPGRCRYANRLCTLATRRRDALRPR